MGWGREKVKDYKSLSSINGSAWGLIGATLEKKVNTDDRGEAPGNGATAPFTERVLRGILHLNPPQQLELVTDLAEQKITKGKFKTRAVAYRGRNDMTDYFYSQYGRKI